MPSLHALLSTTSKNVFGPHIHLFESFTIVLVSFAQCFLVSLTISFEQVFIELLIVISPSAIRITCHYTGLLHYSASVAWLTLLSGDDVCRPPITISGTHAHISWNDVHTTAEVLPPFATHFRSRADSGIGLGPGGVVGLDTPLYDRPLAVPDYRLLHGSDPFAWVRRAVRKRMLADPMLSKSRMHYQIAT